MDWGYHNLLGILPPLMVIPIAERLIVEKLTCLNEANSGKLQPFERITEILTFQKTNIETIFGNYYARIYKDCFPCVFFNKEYFKQFLL